MHRWLPLALLTPALAACDLSRLPPARPFSLEASTARSQFVRAAPLLKAQWERRPDEPGLNYQLSRALDALGDPDAALPLVEKALAANPQSALFHVQAAAVYGHQAQKASLFKQLGFARRAKKELDAAYALDPRNVDALNGLMLFYDQAPSALGGDKAKALELSEAIKSLDPVRGLEAQAQLAHQRKDPAAEEALLRKAVGAAPDYSQVETYNAGLALAALEQANGRPAEAGQLACAALQADPERVEAWSLLAEIAVSSHCGSDLDALLERAAARVPDDLRAHYAAGVALLRAGRHRHRAEALLRRYLTQPPEAGAPSHATARWQLATLLEQTGRVDEAILELERAVAQEPSLEAARRDLRRLKKPS